MANIYTALLAAQKEMQNPQNTATNPFFKSKYAPLPDILKQVRPILNKHGLILQQNTGSNEEGTPYIETILRHTDSTECIKSGRLYLQPDNQKVQGVGSALTYGRRYQLAAFLGISSEDDNDANNPDDKPVKQQQTQSNTPQRKPKKPKAAAKKKPKASKPKDTPNWKQLSKENPELKKVCDVLNRGGFDMDKDTIYVEAGSMHSRGELTDKELDKIEVITGRKPA
jgi:hypothetical protein